jgi:hypothetical protein
VNLEVRVNFLEKKLDKNEVKREEQNGENYVHTKATQMFMIFLLTVLLDKKYGRPEKVACQTERRTAFKTMIGKQQTEESVGIIVVD